ncbi:hypothetical protein PVL29_019519 [Vitis rotundifolia]|uniref:Uncharacterized protein n=1 Tax=Vitis rotundifolia TaxID=103349 RepID=A0AA38Z1G6_VITRO|nr:hypothetical protein PVL29_019519 [Vitis rotundifolia]
MRAIKRPIMVRGCLERTVLESFPKSVVVWMEDLMRGCYGVWGQVAAGYGVEMVLSERT